MHYKRWVKHGDPLHLTIRGKFPQLRDGVWLRVQYIERGRSMDDIAREVKCHETSVLGALKRHGIQSRPVSARISRPFPLLYDMEWLTHEYVDRTRTCTEIAQQLGCSTPTVHYALKRYGIHTRPAKVRSNSRLQNAAWLLTEYVENGRSGQDIAKEIGGCSTAVLSALRRYDIAVRRPEDWLSTHGHCWRGGATPTYFSWRAMKQRCTRPGHVAWEHYGGAGVKICDRWLAFENFLADMGERPSGTFLGRYGDIGNYEPGNCAWMTKVEQGVEAQKKRERSVRSRRNRKRDSDARGVVYFAQVGDAVKVGCTASGINRRLSGLRCRLGRREILLLGTVPGLETAEEDFLELFADVRLSQDERAQRNLPGRDWFHSEPILQAAPWEKT